jgi:hypothetical protein
MGRYLELALATTRDRWARRCAALLSGIVDGELRADLREQFEERAGICEFDGALGREQAERMAFEEVRVHYEEYLAGLDVRQA